MTPPLRRLAVGSTGARPDPAPRRRGVGRDPRHRGRGFRGRHRGTPPGPGRDRRGHDHLSVADRGVALARATIDGPAMPPAWLAWIAGSLPPGLAAEASREPALGTVVVVAGDTRWLNESRDADGRRVDHPNPPFAIPIDAFAVAPREYAPFLPPAWRDEVTRALADGRAVLGQTSADLRRIGQGGTLRFGGTTIRVGAVVPDAAVGYAEVLLSRERGRAIGIVHDRYLLSLPDGDLSDLRFSRLMTRLIPGDLDRDARPGASRFIRIASGVNPPVVTKSIFGEFAAAPNPSNPAFLTIDPAWVREHIVTRRVPLLGRVTCHRLLLGPLTDALTEIRADGLADTIQIYSGCWAARTVQRSPTAPPSQHAYGAAIDINAPFSPFGAPPNFDPRAVADLRGARVPLGRSVPDPRRPPLRMGAAPATGVTPRDACENDPHPCRPGRVGSTGTYGVRDPASTAEGPGRGQRRPGPGRCHRWRGAALARARVAQDRRMGARRTRAGQGARQRLPQRRQGARGRGGRTRRPGSTCCHRSREVRDDQGTADRHAQRTLHAAGRRRGSVPGRRPRLRRQRRGVRDAGSALRALLRERHVGLLRPTTVALDGPDGARRIVDARRDPDDARGHPGEPGPDLGGRAGEGDGVLWAGVDPAALFERGRRPDVGAQPRALGPAGARGLAAGRRRALPALDLPLAGRARRGSRSASRPPAYWLTEDGGACGRRAARASVPRYVPEEAPRHDHRFCVHNLHRAPLRPERLFMQFHGGVYR